MLGLYITWPTSYEALVGRAELKSGMSSNSSPAPIQLSHIQPSGEWVLVTAAAGGVGIAAVQIAKGTIQAVLYCSVS
jgi:NADPH:quinone reductase-like Zn-dependent oxidoreductase